MSDSEDDEPVESDDGFSPSEGIYTRNKHVCCPMASFQKGAKDSVLEFPAAQTVSHEYKIIVRTLEIYCDISHVHWEDIRHILHVCMI